MELEPPSGRTLLIIVFGILARLNSTRKSRNFNHELRYCDRDESRMSARIEK
jgi:hypothetical protein